MGVSNTKNMISIYTSAFNVIKGNFSYAEAIANFCSFADEVVVAVNTSEDNTLQIFQNLALLYKNLFIVQTNFSYTDPGLDGKIKNAALQACAHDVCLQLDLDERVLLSQKKLWYNISNDLLAAQSHAIMVPVIDLFRDEKYIKSIGSKWYLHKRAGAYRGVVNFARLANGHHDTTKSDSCELTDGWGNLLPSIYLLNPQSDIQTKLLSIKQYDLPYVVHYGYLDLDRRIQLNKDFWSNHWSVEAGKQIDIPLDVNFFKDIPIIEHKLALL